MGLISSNALCLFFVWLFGRAVAHKLSAPAYYRALLSDYFPIPRAAAPLLALSITLELSLLALLLLEGFRATGLAISGILLSLYAASMAWQLLQGKTSMACGCSGADSALLISPALILRNVGCAIAAWSLAPYSESWGSWPQLLAAGTLAILLTMTYLWFDHALANAQYMNEDV